MYVGHIDSKRRLWCFNIPYGHVQAGVFARFLWDLSKLGKAESMVRPATMPRNAKFRDELEQEILTGLSKAYPATEQEFSNASPNDRYIL